MKWLDRIPLSALVLVAILFAVAPPSPEPHLLQKLKMLAAGTLTTPLDIFDLLFHGAPLVLVIAKIYRMITR